MTEEAPQPKRLVVGLEGMQCDNCEVQIERRLREVPGVVGVVASLAKGEAEVFYLGNLDIAALQDAIKDEGYRVILGYTPSGDVEGRKPLRHFAEVGAVLLVMVGVYFVFQRLNIFPGRASVPVSRSYGLAFLIGVVASVSTCMAVTGGLLVAAAAKYNTLTGHISDFQRFRTHLYFNAGRLISYAVLGALIGAAGSTFTLSPGANGLIVIVASLVMIVLGLQMLKLLPKLDAAWLRMPKAFTHRMHDLSAKQVRGGAFLLGASTFFFPCGFTQALQLYVLAQGSAATGALIMLSFALGTLPALLALSLFSTFAEGGLQRLFVKVAGIAVVVLGIFSIQGGLTLTKLDSAAAPNASVDTPQQAAVPREQIATQVGDRQIADMKIVDLAYEPSRFVVTQGVPVQWRITAEEAVGCGLVLLAPKIGVQRLLSPIATNIITFVPQQLGEIPFNCGMGMMTPDAAFTVVPKPAG